jgi:hypothetical protein
MNYRITKYNQREISIIGDCLGNRWTSFSDLLKENNQNKAFDIYKETEDKYIQIYNDILIQNNIGRMKIIELEYNSKEDANEILINDLSSNLLEKIKNNTEYCMNDILDIIKLCLREIIWCKFIYENVYIHIGYDYYTYVGGINLNKELIQKYYNNGIIVEEYYSPYL